MSKVFALCGLGLSHLLFLLSYDYDDYGSKKQSIRAGESAMVDNSTLNSISKTINNTHYSSLSDGDNDFSEECAPQTPSTSSAPDGFKQADDRPCDKYGFFIEPDEEVKPDQR